MKVIENIDNFNQLKIEDDNMKVFYKKYLPEVIKVYQRKSKKEAE